MNNLILDSTAYTIWWNSRRLYLGDTANYRCLAALLTASGQPVEHHEMLAAADLGSAVHANDVRTLIYRLKRMLRNGGMHDLAARIRNVRGAYILKVTQDVTQSGTDFYGDIGNDPVDDQR